MSVDVEKKIVETNRTPVTHRVNETVTTTHVPSYREEKDAEADRGNAWIWYIVGIVNLLLLIRLVLYLFGARSVGFTETIYSLTNPLVSPFRGMFNNPQIDGSFFDLAALTAIIVYTIIGWGISRLIDLLARPNNSKKI